MVSIGESDGVDHSTSILIEKHNKPSNSKKYGEDSMLLKDLKVSYNGKSNHLTTGVAFTRNSFEPKQNGKSSMSISAMIKSLDSGAVLTFRNVESAKSHIKGTLQKYSTVLCFLGVTAALTAIVDTQISRTMYYAHVNPVNQTSSTTTDKKVYHVTQIAARTVILVLSVAAAVYLYLYYRTIHTLGVIKHTYYPGSSLFGTVLVYKFLLEVALCLAHVPPGVGLLVPPEVQLIVFLRFYLIARFLRQKHKLMNSKSTRLLASVTKTELSSMFLIKTYFMRSPFVLIISLYFLIVTLGGYLVFMVERTNNYLDTIWMLVVTMTTVGFGDFVPKTVAGRIFVACAAVAGIFLMALCISLVHESLQLTQQEKRILAYVENSDRGRYKKSLAAKTIQTWWKYSRYLKTLHNRDELTPYQWVKLRCLRGNLYSNLTRWKCIRSPQEDHWQKEFQFDNTVMKLTDVSRDVRTIEDFLRTVMLPIIKKEHGIKQELEHKISDADGTSETIKRSCRTTEVPVQKHSAYNFDKPLTRHPNSRNGSPVSLDSVSAPMHYQDNLASTVMFVTNQISIMQDNIDDLYSRTQHDLRNLENVVKTSLMNAMRLQGTPSNRNQSDDC